MKLGLEKVYQLMKQYKNVLLLNGNNFPNGFPSKIVASNHSIDLKENIFDTISKTNIDVYGFLTYDLKNEIEKLESNNKDYLGFKKALFFSPEIEIEFLELEKPSSPAEISVADLICNFTKTAYIETIQKIQNSILEGDVYEVNFCIEYHAYKTDLDPVILYITLNSLSPTPFSCLLKSDTKWLICASPERFLKKTNQSVFSQPIKGTAKRSADPKEDLKQKTELQNSEKERAENLMIVDLVRNDLAKTAICGSVKVDELFKIYSFSQVHQMISTISCEVKQETTVGEIIKNCFPMGSMTGAPKIRCMQFIEEIEKTKRGIFSGAVGYISKEKDFDFNVVIRSMMYNTENGYLSFQVGSAITIDSDPEKEYDECLHKAEAIFKTLGYSA